MIWVLGGTGESYEIINKLKEKNKELIVSVVTEYGQSRLSGTNVRVIRKKLSKKDMKDLINKFNIKIIIDATHPFASNVSENVLTVSKEMSIKYLRYERKEVDLSGYSAEYILPVDGYEEAVEKAVQFEKIFLTIGSNNLTYFTEGITNWENRLIARILPDWKFIKRARQLGFTPANLLAMQGPFSYKLNRVLLEEYKADVLVSKASGSTGGLDTKIKAAFDLEIPVIIIKRPDLNYPVIFTEIKDLISYITGEDSDDN